MKFTEYVMLIEKHVLIKKNVYKWAKHGFFTISMSQKDDQWSGNILTGKEKVPGVAVSKEDHADSLL